MISNRQVLYGLMKLKQIKRIQRLLALPIFQLPVAAVVIFLHTPSFGRLPRCARPDRICKSPNYTALLGALHDAQPGAPGIPPAENTIGTADIHRRQRIWSALLRKSAGNSLALI